MDSSKRSLKSFLLHNGNIKPSIPVAHVVGMKETYDSMTAILKVIKQSHYEVKELPPRFEFVVGKQNVQYQPLMDPLKIYLLPLHIKLGLMMNFVKALNPERETFQSLKEKFGVILIDAKLKAGVFIGP